MEECAGIAEVIRVTKHPVVELAEGVEVGRSTIHARMYATADKYSHDLLVEISKPSGVRFSSKRKGLSNEKWRIQLRLWRGAEGRRQIGNFDFPCCSGKSSVKLL